MGGPGTLSSYPWAPCLAAAYASRPASRLSNLRLWAPKSRSLPRLRVSPPYPPAQPLNPPSPPPGTEGDTGAEGPVRYPRLGLAPGPKDLPPPPDYNPPHSWVGDRPAAAHALPRVGGCSGDGGARPSRRPGRGQAGLKPRTHHLGPQGGGPARDGRVGTARALAVERTAQAGNLYCGAAA